MQHTLPRRLERSFIVEGLPQDGLVPELVVTELDSVAGVGAVTVEAAGPWTHSRASRIGVDGYYRFSRELATPSSRSHTPNCDAFF